jgi:hypothetical protein
LESQGKLPEEHLQLVTDFIETCRNFILDLLYKNSSDFSPNYVKEYGLWTIQRWPAWNAATLWRQRAISWRRLTSQQRLLFFLSNPPTGEKL